MNDNVQLKNELRNLGLLLDDRGGIRAASGAAIGTGTADDLRAVLIEKKVGPEDRIRILRSVERLRAGVPA